MKKIELIILERDELIQALINSKIRNIMGLVQVENEDELKGYIKALQWVIAE